MERFIINELVQWKNSPRRKPLILEGARQVGKTWAVKEFARREYKYLAYVNFEEAKHLRSLFQQDYDIERISKVIQTHCNVPCTPGETLVFLDEIQEAEGGLTALKYFQENSPQQHIVVAGSLLGISLHKGVSFPVGKVNFLKMSPMNFREFLLAIGKKGLSEAIASGDWDILDTFHGQLTDFLKIYYMVGGMPEAVQAYVDSASWHDVRTIQNEILRGYEDDFSKHTDGILTERIRQIWNSVPTQLSKENRKFIFGLVREGARAREYENALQWLLDAGLLHSVHCVSSIKTPLESYRDSKSFKIFLNDVGLLSAMCNLSPDVLLHGSDIFVEFKGALTEQYVFGQLNEKTQLYYWAKDNSRQEIDFIIQKNGKIIPIECKAEENLKSKSLTSFINEHSPHVGYKISMKPHKESGAIVKNIPLYSAGEIIEL